MKEKLKVALIKNPVCKDLHVRSAGRKNKIKQKRLRALAYIFSDTCVRVCHCSETDSKFNILQVQVSEVA